MSRYEWPPAPPKKRGRAAERRAWNSGRAGAPSPPPAGGGGGPVPGPVGAAPGGPPAAGAPPHRWVSIGPNTTLRGMADSDPRVSGRVRDLAVSADGLRVYAASALGGLWYSETSGATWESVAPYAMTPVRDLGVGSATLSSGCLLVKFDPGGDPDQDIVWVGTGEPDPNRNPRDHGVVGQWGGIGVLKAQGPVQRTRDNQGADPWQREAQPTVGYVGLRGQGCYAIVADPDEPERIVVASTFGLHLREPNGTWSRLIVPAWEAIAANSSATAMVTDVVWVKTPAGSRLWVAVGGSTDPMQGTVSAIKGLWRGDAGASGDLTRVQLPGAATDAGRRGLLRLALAVAPSDPRILYVLANAPRLWRIDGDAAARRVRFVPGQLFNGDPGQSGYDMAIAVDPDDPQRLMIGGANVPATIDTASGNFDAALYRISLRLPVPAANAEWRTTYTSGNQAHESFVGAEVHADVHRIRWVRPTGAITSAVYVGCDGGVWHSRNAGERLSFVARTSGMVVSQPVTIASHPTSPGVTLLGAQDNGSQLRIGEGVWRRVLENADSGGVTFDPGRGDRMLAQSTNSLWRDQTGTWRMPTWRAAAGGAERTESVNSEFYSTPAAHLRADGVTQVAIGTTRVWYSERWLNQLWDGVVGVWRFAGFTLPSGTDPRSGDAQDTATDVIPPGPQTPLLPPESIGIRVLRWAGDHRLYALMRGAVYRFDRNPVNMSWRRTTIHLRTAASPLSVPAPGPMLPRPGSLNDLAVHDSTRGPHGSFYLATSNVEEPVWWFDGNTTFHPTGLGAGATTAGATAYSVVVDPEHREVVFVGNSIGVWRGVLDSATFTWAWSAFNVGLPETAVQDLVIARWPRPGGQLRLLRGGLQSRGVWEVELDRPFAPLTSVRVHPYDTRLVLPTPTDDSLFRTGDPDPLWHLDWADARARDFRTVSGLAAAHPDGTAPGQFLWHASPDIRVRPAPGSAALAAPGTLPWTGPPADRFALWAVQTALHTLDPLLVADGRWTAMFAARLRQVRQRLALSNAARVDADLWNHAQVQAGFWADPWAEGGPTEADLVERWVGMATPRPGLPSAAAVSPASLGVRPERAMVELCLHHRGDPLPASEAACLLLKFPLPDVAATWGALPTAPLLAVLPAVRAAMRAAPAAGGPLPGAALPAGFAVGDVACAIRRPSRAADSGQPAVIRFELDFTPVGPVDPAHPPRFLLLALVCDADPATPALTGATLRDLILNSPHAAARSVEVVIP